jgi:SAM-dependent methyltransferase
MTDILTLKTRVLENKFIPVPPQNRNQSSCMAVEDGFLAMGTAMAGLLLQEGLKPDHRVLDLGCGIGRLALPLTQYLSEKGSYFGLDINLDAVSWCHEHITRAYRNFRFAVVNARNDHYRNPFEYGRSRLPDSVLPIPDTRFDCVTAFSLFTHLLAEETRFYLQFIADRLTPDGFFFTTWFLLDGDSLRGIAEGKSRFLFDIDGDGPAHLLKDCGTVSHAIAYERSSLLKMAEEAGLVLIRETRAGWHEGRPGQDTMVWRRKN